MGDYEIVIGLEVHVQLSTNTKLFCSCPRSFGDGANTNVCEVCAGMPGVLPVLNKKAVEYAVKMGLAVHCEINNDSVFARKNYFYPDLPKGYQISQFEKPICGKGYVEINTSKGIKQIGITRIHLEDDAGKNIHSTHEPKSFVDLNRAGTPLIEIVSEPDMRSPEEAVAYLKTLYGIVTTLGFSDGNMEEGNFRCDANISLRPWGQKEFGTRTELKNLNSFRNIQRAIECEIVRQEDLLSEGKVIIQETRLYDSDKNKTQSMRSKEEAQDYRYFPDPDLIPIHIDEKDLQEWKNSQEELPHIRKKRYQNEFQLPEQDAERIAYDRYLTHFFEASIALYNDPKKIANMIQGMLMRELNARNLETKNIAIKPEAFAELAKVIEDKIISFTIASDIFSALFETGQMPKAYIEAKGLAQVSDTNAIDKVLLEIIEANPTEAAEYKAGKIKLQGFFVGQVMKKMQGKANPALVNEGLNRYLKGEI